MKFTKFEQANINLTYPKEAGGINVPAYHDGAQTVICIELENQDLADLAANNGKLYITLLSGKSVPPISVTAKPPFFSSKDAYCNVFYFRQDDATVVRAIYNMRDSNAPDMIAVDNHQWVRDILRPNEFAMGKKVKVGEAYMREAGGAEVDLAPKVIGAEMIGMICCLTPEGKEIAKPMFQKRKAHTIPLGVDASKVDLVPQLQAPELPEEPAPQASDLPVAPSIPDGQWSDPAVNDTLPEVFGVEGDTWPNKVVQEWVEDAEEKTGWRGLGWYWSDQALHVNFEYFEIAKVTQVDKHGNPIEAQLRQIQPLKDPA